VYCSLEIVETGLIATLKYTSSPVVIPPSVPPELFVSGLILRSINDNLLESFIEEGPYLSLCSDPLFFK